MSVNEALFSSERQDWETPEQLFNELDREFKFDIDVCASASNKKCSNYFDISVDGLKQDWQGVCWMNPPYGRGVDKWVEKAYNESQKGATVVCLLPARTDTRWFHSFVYNKAEIRFLKGRLKFVGAESSAPFPSMVVIFRKEDK